MSGDYSEVVSRLLLSRILEENGFSGKNGKKIKIYLKSREIFALEKNQYSGLPKNIKILNESPNQILNLEENKDEYFEYLERIINGRKIKS